eukprot:748297-Hanusia_phi.AAC.1
MTRKRGGAGRGEETNGRRGGKRMRLRDSCQRQGLDNARCILKHLDGAGEQDGGDSAVDIVEESLRHLEG